MQAPLWLIVPPVSTAVNSPTPETVTGTPASATYRAAEGAVTLSVPALPVNVSVELPPVAVPQVAVIWVTETVWWIERPPMRPEPMGIARIRPSRPGIRGSVRPDRMPPCRSGPRRTGFGTGDVREQSRSCIVLGFGIRHLMGNEGEGRRTLDTVRSTPDAQ